MNNPPTPRPLSAAALILLLAASPLALAADRIERKDGRVLEGRIVDESKDSITIETRSGELSVRQKVAKSAIRDIQRESREGPGYCVIPIEGVIGLEVKADALRRALLDARRAGANIIVLSIDSPGGYIAERDALLGVIKEFKDLQFVAHIRRALSSAAVLALACPRIYMTERATMGAAVAYRILPDGSAAPLEAKYRSAVQAGERAASAMGGRADLWVRGMTETDLELAIVTDAAGANPKLVEAGTQWEGEKVIKRKGQILTLTSAEAKDWGLSAGTAKDTGDIRKLLAIDKWHDAGDGPAGIMLANARAARAKLKDAQERQRDLVHIDAEAAAAMERVAAATKQLERINTAFNRDAGPILSEVQAQLTRAQNVGASPQELAAIKADGTRRIEEIRARYAEPYTQAMAAGNAAVKELADLKTKRAEVLADLQH
jgi:membrane-bound serine protease (ClpP class)